MPIYTKKWAWKVTSDNKEIYISEIYIKNPSRIYSRHSKKGTFLIFGQPSTIVPLCCQDCMLDKNKHLIENSYILQAKTVKMYKTRNACFFIWKISITYIQTFLQKKNVYRECQLCICVSCERMPLINATLQLFKNVR